MGTMRRRCTRQLIRARFRSLECGNEYFTQILRNSNSFTFNATCMSDATGKKLAGAALKSFMTKCEKDSKAKCELDSKEKKLFGAAKNSHMKKFTTDAVGA